ncbi:hypothetical protein [Thermoactinomyces mirandus]|uniref:Uncharacterized protein n=1 Tax=Thermoactinomyces mirandus TaxID=2756294 RepID=A0A7W1XV19_9BACL|nr:hypothetical protein [Thermoactinomyces mirandus]MBA4603520.1 hypothetical protein [Thermoactinomyces mirandus]
MGKFLRPEEAFMFGYKPACACQSGNPRLKPYLDKLLEKGYPNVFGWNILRDDYTFFHNEETNKSF